MPRSHGPTLVAWIGRADLQAISQSEESGVGPICQAVISRSFEHVDLLLNFSREEGADYLAWLRPKTQAPIYIHPVALTSPTAWAEIYAAAIAVVDPLARRPGARLTFHLSPGTPAMAAVWLILGKTRYPAELIETSRQHGVKTASVPFELSAELAPDPCAASSPSCTPRSASSSPCARARSRTAFAAENNLSSADIQQVNQVVGVVPAAHTAPSATSAPVQSSSPVMRPETTPAMTPHQEYRHRLYQIVNRYNPERMDQHLLLLYLQIRVLLNLHQRQQPRRVMMLRLRITARRVARAMTEEVLLLQFLLLQVEATTAVLHRGVHEVIVRLHVRDNPDL